MLFGVLSIKIKEGIKGVFHLIFCPELTKKDTANGNEVLNTE